jgi:nitroreductase
MMNKLQSALELRYGGMAPATDLTPAAGDELLQHLLGHRSVRAYQDCALPAGTLELLLAAAQSAASSSNLQSWTVVAVEDEARKARLAEWCGSQEHVRKAPLFLVWLADLSRLDRVAAREQSPADANRYFDQFLVAAVDAALAAQNAVVAAEAMGLGTVYIGGIRNHADAVSQELKLPSHVFPVFGLCVGVPDPAQAAAVKPRLAQSVVLHREVYADPASGEEEQGIRNYDAVVQAFQAEQGLPQVGWSAPAAKRVADSHCLSGRDALGRYLEQQGFELL